MLRARRSQPRLWCAALPVTIRPYASPGLSSTGSAANAIAPSSPQRLPRSAALALPERHLGLVQAGEHANLKGLIDRLADMAEHHFRLDTILAKATPLGVAAAARAAIP